MSHTKMKIFTCSLERVRVRHFKQWTVQSDCLPYHRMTSAGHFIIGQIVKVYNNYCKTRQTTFVNIIAIKIILYSITLLSFGKHFFYNKSYFTPLL